MNAEKLAEFGHLIDKLDESAIEAGRLVGLSNDAKKLAEEACDVFEGAARAVEQFVANCGWHVARPQ